MPQLIFTNGGDVMMADIHGRFVRTLVPSQGRGYAVGVAYLWHSDKVFWSDTYTKKVSLDHCLVIFLMTSFYLCTVFIVSLSECKTQGTWVQHYSSAVIIYVYHRESNTVAAVAYVGSS